MIERRNFLNLAGSTGAVVLAMARRVFAADQGEAPRHTKPSKGPIPRRTLGKTGERVSIVGIGGHHLGRALVEESESIRIVRTALDSGAPISSTTVGITTTARARFGLERRCAMAIATRHF